MSARHLAFTGFFLLVSSLAWPPISMGDVSQKQVRIEARIVEVSQAQIENLLYDTASGRDTKADIALLIKSLPDRSTQIEATVVSYGGGADFRRIETHRPLLVLPTIGEGGAMNMRIEPADIEKIYVNKSSAAAPVAPILFGIIGSQYEGPGARAASTPGQVCPVTGETVGGGESERGDIAKGIDKAGMAAGMALLTSQAKGQLDGLKIRWQLSPDIRYDKFDLKFDTFNKNSKRTETLTKTFNFDAGLSARMTARIKYLPLQYATTNTSGGVTAEQKVTTVPYQRNRLRITVESILRGQGADAEGWVPQKSQLEYAASDYWPEYDHEWDDFDEDGYCYECGHYEPEADDFNYDEDGNYLGDTRTAPEKLTRILMDPEVIESLTRGTVTGEKATFITDYPVTRALFRTEAFNKKTNQLLVLVTPVLIKPNDSAD